MTPARCPFSLLVCAHTPARHQSPPKALRCSHFSPHPGDLCPQSPLSLTTWRLQGKSPFPQPQPVAPTRVSRGTRRLRAAQQRRGEEKPRARGATRNRPRGLRGPQGLPRCGRPCPAPDEPDPGGPQSGASSITYRRVRPFNGSPEVSGRATLPGGAGRGGALERAPLPHQVCLFSSLAGWLRPAPAHCAGCTVEPMGAGLAQNT